MAMLEQKNRMITDHWIVVDCAERRKKSCEAKLETGERCYAFHRKIEVVESGRCYLIIYCFKHIFILLSKNDWYNDKLSYYCVQNMFQI